MKETSQYHVCPTHMLYGSHTNCGISLNSFFLKKTQQNVQMCHKCIMMSEGVCVFTSHVCVHHIRYSRGIAVFNK